MDAKVGLQLAKRYADNPLRKGNAYLNASEWVDTFVDLSQWNVQAGAVADGEWYTEAPGTWIDIAKSLEGLNLDSFRLCAKWRCRQLDTDDNSYLMVTAAPYGAVTTSTANMFGVRFERTGEGTGRFYVLTLDGSSDALAYNGITVGDEYWFVIAKEPGNNYLTASVFKSNGEYACAVTAFIGKTIRNIQLRTRAGQNGNTLSDVNLKLHNSPMRQKLIAAPTIIAPFGHYTDLVSGGDADKAFHIHIPPFYTGLTKHRLAILNRSAASNITQFNADTDRKTRSLVYALLQKGYFVGMSQTHGQNWGNRAGVDDIYAMYEYAQRRFNLDGQVVMFSHSMGGLNCWNFAKFYPDLVRRIVALYPVCNLQQMFGSMSFKSQIKAAYGFEDDGDFATATEGYDPLASDHVALLKHIPIKIWHGDADTTVDLAENSAALSTAIAAAGGDQCELVIVGGGTHYSSDMWNVNDIVAFLDA